MIGTKDTLLALLGVIGSVIAGAFGGWTSAMTTLLICMVIDYVTGLICAGVFHKSPKSETGALESNACFKGLIRKGMILLIILVACRIDMILDPSGSYVKDGTCIAFIINEILSIIENASIMGLKMPTVFTKAIEVLQKSTEKEGEG